MILEIYLREIVNQKYLYCRYINILVETEYLVMIKALITQPAYQDRKR